MYFSLGFLITPVNFLNPFFRRRSRCRRRRPRRRGPHRRVSSLGYLNRHPLKGIGKLIGVIRKPKEKYIFNFIQEKLKKF